METTNYVNFEIETIDFNALTPEELLAERQQHILTALPQFFEVYEEPVENTLVHCLKPDVREVMGDEWYEIIRDFVSLDCSNLEDEELEIVFLHRLNQYLSKGITEDHGAWVYWFVDRIEAKIANKTRKKSDFEVFEEGLYKYFDADCLPDGSFAEIERFRPGIKEKLGDTWCQIVEEYFLMGEEDELDWQDVEFRFWRHLNVYAHEGGCIRDDGRWGARLIGIIEAALSTNADTVDFH